MSVVETKPNAPLAPIQTAGVKAPPHPFDAKWHIHQNDEVFGPYTGHELKTFAADGIIDATTSVVRAGKEDWKKAAEDPVLARIFVTSPPPGPAAVMAEKGATVVQVTNMSPNLAAAAMLEDGEFGPKSAGLAFFLSFLICGVGQMYNGQVAKGILMLIGSVFLWFILLGWIIWIDAYQTAKRMNARYHRRLLAGLPI